MLVVSRCSSSAFEDVENVDRIVRATNVSWQYENEYFIFVRNGEKGEGRLDDWVEGTVFASEAGERPRPRGLVVGVKVCQWV